MIALAKARESLASIVKDSLFRRLFKNSALLGASKIITAVLGLAYLALAAHALGAHGLGLLILINTYTIVLRELFTFKSWQALIRYGADYLEENRHEEMQSLLKFSLLLDVFGIAVATTLGFFTATHFAPFFNIPAEHSTQLQLYCFVLLFYLKSTPVGLLRLCNRFDLLAWQALVAPLIRFVGVVIAYLLQAELWVYLLVWFLANATAGLTLLLFGYSECRRQGLFKNMSGKLRGLTKAHPGIWGFVWISNLQSTLNLTGSHISTLAVGMVLGPAGAGLYKVAQESANLLSKPTLFLTQTIYPELARMNKKETVEHIWSVITKSAVLALGFALIVLLLIVAGGKFLLAMIFGSEFVGAYEVMLYLMFAASLTMATFSLEPALYSIGRPGVALRIKTITSLLHVAITFLLLTQMGLTGAGIATLISVAVTSLLMILSARRLFSETQTEQ